MSDSDVRNLICCCCGATTRGRQHWNRDTGFGLCARCAKWIPEKWPDTDMVRTYGTPGVHYLLTDKDEGGVL